jgi:hypothetical protein
MLQVTLVATMMMVAMMAVGVILVVTVAGTDNKFHQKFILILINLSFYL